MAIGLAQSIQLPISIFATIGNSWSGILIYLSQSLSLQELLLAPIVEGFGLGRFQLRN